MDQSIVFRVMRLTQPELAPPREGFPAEDLVSDAVHNPPPTPEHPFAVRLTGPACPSDLLVLPQNFGIVYLGTQFSALVTVTNASCKPVTLVGIKIEIATERSKAVLFDNTAAPLPNLQPGQHQELVIKQDIKELGTHTLTTSAAYHAAGDSEQHFLPQVFRFTTTNPLIVRTRHRVVGSRVYLEATLENATKGTMLLEAVTLQASPYSAQPLLPPPPPAVGTLQAYLSQATVIPEGGAANFLFRLTTAQGSGRLAGRLAADGAAPLGRVHIRWRGPMGEPALLQTQQITLARAAAAAAAEKQQEVELRLVGLPQRVVQLRAFWAEARVVNHSERATGPLMLTWASPSSGSASGDAAYDASLLGPPSFQVMLVGSQAVALPALQPMQAASVPVQLLPLGCGTQRITGLLLSDAAGGRVYDALTPVEVFVESAA